ncbi:hypothetical protein V8G54_033835 [Vigna mungo]|uniref:Uncharacterized protein n=1 Tax=Vigna mungo TaxID=3915 RepID=A0AAQ3MP71_VIGMU
MTSENPAQRRKSGKWLLPQDDRGRCVRGEVRKMTSKIPSQRKKHSGEVREMTSEIPAQRRKFEKELLSDSALSTPNRKELHEELDDRSIARKDDRSHTNASKCTAQQFPLCRFDRSTVIFTVERFPSNRFERSAVHSGAQRHT